MKASRGSSRMGTALISRGSGMEVGMSFML